MKTLIKIFGFIITAIVICASLSSCDNVVARSYGGTTKINVKQGYKVTEATWKDDGSVWYLIEPMEDNYTPKQKEFVEDSPYGVMEGKVIFNETR